MDGRQDKVHVLSPSLTDHTADSFRLLVDVVKDYAVFSLDTAGCIASWNIGAFRLFGYSQEEMLGQPWSRLLPATTQAKPQQQLSQALQQGRSQDTAPCVRQDGSVFLAEVTLVPVWTPDGSHTGYLQVVHDLTRPQEVTSFAPPSTLEDHAPAQELIETTLQRTSALLQAVVDNTTDAIFVKDRDGRYLLFNQAASQFVGVPVEEVLGKDDTALFDPAGAAELLARHRQIIQTGETVTAEEYLTAAGVSRVYLATKAPYRDAQGNILGVIGISRDITARKQAEDALRDSQARLRAALEGGKICTWVWELKRQTLFWDASARRLFDWPPEQTPEISIASFLSLIHPDDLPRVEGAIANILQGKENPSLEFRCRRSDGTFTHVIVRGQLEYDAAGQPLRMIGTCADITKHVRLEERYRQAQKMEAIGQLAGGIAHDFNNMLTVILGLSEVLLSDLPEDSPLRNYVMDIRNAGERASALTRQLLAFSRRQVMAPQVLDLNQVIAGTARMLQRLIGEDICLMTTLAPALHHVRVDPGQMEQVVLNLAVNARDAMPQGGQLTITTRNAELDQDYCFKHPGVRPGSYVQLSITDTGCGMSSEVQSHIFEPFFTTKEHGKGTGLGLATVFGIVQQSEGCCDVTSEEGRGTCFTMYLPAVAAEVPVSPPENSREVALHGSATILLAEDDAVVRHIMKMSLEAYGYTVLEASNGQQALQHIAKLEQPLQLLITDVVMPEMSGRQLAEQLCSHFPQLRVLFMSGYTDDVMIRQGMFPNQQAFLQKPFAPLALLKKVREVLDG